MGNMAQSMDSDSDTNEHILWNRSFKVTRKPKSSKLATQILDPRYFRDMNTFCNNLAKTYFNRHGVFVTPDEVEGTIRLWADRADLTPIGDIEINIFQIMESQVANFPGWTPSSEAIVIPFEETEEDEQLEDSPT